VVARQGQGTPNIEDEDEDDDEDDLRGALFAFPLVPGVPARCRRSFPLNLCACLLHSEHTKRMQNPFDTL
jgi:hypothetical protein